MCSLRFLGMGEKPGKRYEAGRESGYRNQDLTLAR
jgi:hypothetical protein